MTGPCTIKGHLHKMGLVNADYAKKRKMFFAYYGHRKGCAFTSCSSAHPLHMDEWDMPILWKCNNVRIMFFVNSRLNLKPPSGSHVLIAVSGAINDLSESPLPICLIAHYYRNYHMCILVYNHRKIFGAGLLVHSFLEGWHSRFILFFLLPFFVFFFCFKTSFTFLGQCRLNCYKYHQVWSNLRTWPITYGKLTKSLPHKKRMSAKQRMNAVCDLVGLDRGAWYWNHSRNQTTLSSD